MDKLQHFPDNTEQFVSHPRHARPGIHVFPDKLYVITCLENPLRWRSRYANYWRFQKHVEDAGAILITVESAFGGRAFEVTEPGNPYHVQVRVHDELFRKENLQNRGAEILPLGTRYVAFIDADVTFTRHDWAQESLHLLQHYDVIQMYAKFADLNSNNEIISQSNSFMYSFVNNIAGGSGPNSGWITPALAKPSKWSGAPGLAWAYRTTALDQLGGLLDRCILGGGDAHMAFGLAQKYTEAQLHAEYKAGTDSYRRYIATWQQNAARLKRNVGYMDGMLLHMWHGPKSKRGYSHRWRILDRFAYDPFVDVMQDHQGVLQLTGNKPEMRDELRAYFRSRTEDDCY